MTLTTTRLLTLCGTAAALAMFPATTSSATDVTMQFVFENFPNAANLTNPYLTFGTGDVFFYKAETPDGCEWSVVSTGGLETIDTDPSGGVRNLDVREILDFEYEDEECDGPDDPELREKTFDWYGQDSSGNIWYFGEDTQNCEGEGNCEQGGGTWRAFEEGALPGIIMLGDPDGGERYRQELAEGVAEDWAKVMNTNNHPVLRLEDAVEGPFEDCLVTKEWNDLSPGSTEQKTYCQEVGNLVLIEEHSGKLVRFELVGDPDEAADADAFTFRVPKN